MQLHGKTPGGQLDAEQIRWGSEQPVSKGRREERKGLNKELDRKGGREEGQKKGREGRREGDINKASISSEYSE